MSLLKDIKSNKLHKDNIVRRDKKAREIIEKKGVDIQSSKQKIFPGQLIAFNYMNPIMKEELEYYDAKPVTLFFGSMKDKEGNLRVIGFNIHYYPPKYRFVILDKIFERFDSYYESNKHPKEGILKTKIPDFNPQGIMAGLKQYGLDFGIRMYDPKRMKKTCAIPIEDWKDVVFSEGWFKKKTRDQIHKFWNEFRNKNS